MPPWLQVTFRNIDASPAVEAKITALVKKAVS